MLPFRRQACSRLARRRPALVVVGGGFRWQRNYFPNGEFRARVLLASISDHGRKLIYSVELFSGDLESNAEKNHPIA